MVNAQAGHPMSLSRRRLLTRSAVAAVALAGLPAVGAGAAPVLRRANAVTLAFWHGWTGADNTEMLQQVIDKYNAENGDGTRIEATALPWDELFAKLVIATAAGNPPDVVMAHPTELPGFIERGILEPLDDIVRSVGPDISVIPDYALRAAQWKGKLYAIPGDVHSQGLYYNVEMVEQAGLDPARPPKTMAEFLDWAQRLTLKAGNGEVTQYGVHIPAVGAGPRWIWYSLLEQFGGKFLDGDGKAAVDSSASQQALQVLIDLIHTHGVATTETGAGVDPFGARRVAMRLIGPWEVNLRVRQGIKFATAPVPTIGSRPAAWANSHSLSLARQRDSSRYDTSMRFIKWFFDNYATPAKLVGIIPTNPAARSSREFVDDARYQYYKAFEDSLPVAVFEPAVPQYTEIFAFGKATPLTTNLEAALARSKSIPEALRDMKAGIDDALAQPVA